MSMIGTLRHVGMIEDAVIERLREWSSTYLGEVEDQQGIERNFLARLRAVEPISEAARFPEDQLPAAFVVCPGTSEEPQADGAGYYEATYSVGVMVVVSAVTERDTRRMAQMYGAAIRGCLLQRRTLGGLLRTLHWTGESLDDLPVEGRRTHQASIQVFDAVLAEVVSWKDGPTYATAVPVPAWDPLPDWPQADPVTVEVTKEAIEDG